MKKFAVYPGWVMSRGDGDWHYISAGHLMRLYQVRQHECMVFEDQQDFLGARDIRDRLLPLRPLTGVDYRPVSQRERELYPLNRADPHQ